MRGRHFRLHPRGGMCVARAVLAPRIRTTNTGGNTTGREPADEPERHEDRLSIAGGRLIELRTGNPHLGLAVTTSNTWSVSALNARRSSNGWRRVDSDSSIVKSILDSSLGGERPGRASQYNRRFLTSSIFPWSFENSQELVTCHIISIPRSPVKTPV
jgi:hypothetical protein